MAELNYIERTLVNRYITLEDEIKMHQYTQKSILHKLAEQAPHKVGDIIKWTEKFENQPDRERKAAVKRVIPCIYFHEGQLMSFKYDYEFVALKKDGTVSKNNVCVCYTYEWTDEHINI